MGTQVTSITCCSEREDTPLGAMGHPNMKVLEPIRTWPLDECFGEDLWKLGPTPDCVLSGRVGDSMVEHLSESPL